MRTPEFDGLAVELHHGEGFDAGEEAHGSAALAVRVAAPDERCFGVAVAKAHVVLGAIAPDREVEPLRERIDDGDAHAVEAAGNLVGVLVEFPARVQLSHDDFGGRDAFAGVDVRRNAAPVIGDFDGSIRVQNHMHMLGMPRESLVNRVVHHLVDHVVEPGPVVRITDIHPRPFADRVQALENLDGIGIVGGCRHGCCHDLESSENRCSNVGARTSFVLIFQPFSQRPMGLF